MLVAIFGGTTSVLNRTLKEVPPSLLMFYHGLAGMLVMLIWILIEAVVSGNGIRMLSYSKYQMLIMVLATILNSVAITSTTIAFQSDSSGFITLIGNSAAVYCFLFDTFIFHETFTMVEAIGILVILTVVITVAIFKLREKNKQS